MREGYGLLREFAAELLQLSADRLIFSHLAFDEVDSQAGAMGEALGGKNIDVAEPILRCLEVSKLDMALVDQSLYAKVDGPEANPKLLGDLALRGIGSAFNEAKDLEMHVLALLGNFVTDHGVGQ